MQHIHVWEGMYIAFDRHGDILNISKWPVYILQLLGVAWATTQQDPCRLADVRRFITASSLSSQVAVP